MYKLTLRPTSFFKTLVDHEVTVELKNDIQIRGTLKSVDQYLNIKLDDISVVEEVKYPHLVGSAKVFFALVLRVHVRECRHIREDMEDMLLRNGIAQRSAIRRGERLFANSTMIVFGQECLYSR
jgi:small nuclear ribonucleoprotein (snRNP)-like protein